MQRYKLLFKEAAVRRVVAPTRAYAQNKIDDADKKNTARTGGFLPITLFHIESAHSRLGMILYVSSILQSCTFSMMAEWDNNGSRTEVELTSKRYRHQNQTLET